MRFFVDLESVQEKPARYAALLRAVGAAVPSSRLAEWTQVLGYFAREFGTTRRVLVRRREAKAPSVRARYVLRPWSSTLVPGPHAGQWLGFVCEYHESTRALVVVEREAIAQHPVQPGEKVCAGEWLHEKLRFTPAYCDTEASTLLKSLSVPRPDEGADPVWARWREYLAWRRKVAEAKAAESYAYRACDARDPRAVRFLLRDEFSLDKIRRRFHDEELRVGDDPRDPRAPQGLFRRVRALTDGTLAVEVDLSVSNKSIQSLPSEGRLRIAMEGELATLEVQQEALRRLQEGRAGQADLGRWLLHPESVPALKGRSEQEPSSWEPERALNPQQREAVQRVLDFDSLFLLWGPPGTGKTTVIAEICTQYTRRHRRVLVASQANLAVEQVLARLPVRPEVRPVWVSTARRRDGGAGDVARFRLGWLTSVRTAVLADLTAEEATALEEAEQRWRRLRESWCDLLGAETIESSGPDEEAFYLQQANVVGATCHEAGKSDFIASPRFAARFDLVVIDEVSKATPPELLPPLLLGRRLLLVGDHRQLPPLFRDEHFEDAIEHGELSRDEVERFKDLVTASWFEHAFSAVPASARQGLLRQYRMHPQIMEAVNLFYADQPLEAGDDYQALASAKRHGLVLRDAVGEVWCGPRQHLAWIDTERNEAGQLYAAERIGTSRRNAVEADAVVALLRELQAQPGARDWSVAVISFYKAQIGLLREKIRAANLPSDWLQVNRDVNTVDQFQGSERDIVIVSLVRTDERLSGEFARDFRRLNVALSRARRLLVVLGHGRAFGQAQLDVPSTQAGVSERRSPYRTVMELARRAGAWTTPIRLRNKEATR